MELLSDNAATAPLPSERKKKIYGTIRSSNICGANEAFSSTDGSEFWFDCWARALWRNWGKMEALLIDSQLLGLFLSRFYHPPSPAHTHTHTLPCCRKKRFFLGGGGFIAYKQGTRSWSISIGTDVCTFFPKPSGEILPSQSAILMHCAVITHVEKKKQESITSTSPADVTQCVALLSGRTRAVLRCRFVAQAENWILRSFRGLTQVMLS